MDAICVPRPRLPEMYSDSFMLHNVAPSYVYCKHQATNKSSRMLAMKTIDEIRYSNLEKLVMDAAAPGNDIGKGLSNLVKSANARNKKLSREMLYQILTRRETASGTVRNVGDALARGIEDALRLEHGWMDNDHSQVQAIPALAIDANTIANIVAVYCQSDEMGRKGILAAVEAAKHLAGLNTSVGNNKLELGR